jgi:uncharacterized protein
MRPGRPSSWILLALSLPALFGLGCDRKPSGAAPAGSGVSVTVPGTPALDGCGNAAHCATGCAQGRREDCRQAGLAYLEGMGVERSATRAAELLRAACDRGDPPGCTALGALLEEGATGPRDAAGALACFQKACEGGEPMGCNNLANRYHDGEGVARDLSRAGELYDRACQAGSGMACSSLAKAHLAGEGVAKDADRAARLFGRSAELLQKGCDEGSARACGQIGWLHERGLGVPKDAARARRSYEAGCQGDDAASCYDLATIHLSARADDPSVPVLLERACGLGLPQACMEQCSRLTRGEAADPRGPSSFCERACNHGLAIGCTYLGACYERGDGVPADREKAALSYRRGCDGKDPAGCQNVARLTAR